MKSSWCCLQYICLPSPKALMCSHIPRRFRNWRGGLMWVRLWLQQSSNIWHHPWCVNWSRILLEILVRCGSCCMFSTLLTSNVFAFDTFIFTFAYCQGGRVILRLNSFDALMQVCLKPWAEGLHKLSHGSTPQFVFFSQTPFKKFWWTFLVYFHPTTSETEKRCLSFDIVHVKMISHHISKLGRGEWVIKEDASGCGLMVKVVPAWIVWTGVLLPWYNSRVRVPGKQVSTY